MPTKTTLYTHVVNVCEDFLGPAGERFIRRQIENHLEIKPESIKKKDLDELIKWSSLAFALLTNNRQEVEQFTNQLSSIHSEAES